MHKEILKFIPHEALEVCETLSSQNIESSFVGGVVKEGLLNKTTYDIDIAVNASPQYIENILHHANIKTIPLGIEYGTITVITKHLRLELTSLRKDTKTDGRYATVQFEANWLEDAARRDFTINSIYMDMKGNIFDPFNGLADFKQGIIKFIGNASERICEDYLRILRFYRFYARYGKNEINQEAQQAISQNIKGLNLLSKERIQDEVLKLLGEKNLFIALKNMLKANIPQQLWNIKGNIDNIQKLLEIEKKYNFSPCPLLRLHAWLEADINFYKNYFVLSKKQCSYIASLLKGQNIHNPRELLYFFDENNAKKIVILNSILNNNKNMLNSLEGISSFNKPIFPISAQNIINLGEKRGVFIGKVLKSCETWWIENHFEPSFNHCLEYCKSLLKEYSLCAQ